MTSCYEVGEHTHLCLFRLPSERVHGFLSLQACAGIKPSLFRVWRSAFFVQGLALPLAVWSLALLAALCLKSGL